ncbi:MAG: hypothetical protein IH934_02335 [Nanoarchaeota archaeon]|nr:hypothetical protein [Nanoarchaeota archaeon]
MANKSLNFSMKKIKEGSAEIFIPKEGKISKKLPVFYNPIMQLNRDITILLLQQFPIVNLCDPLAASGIRAIRFAKELKYKSIIANDLSEKATALIKKNIEHNKVKFVIKNEDANIMLLNSKGFDYIDIDPFGTSNSYLDSAVKRISRNGILAVTNTDTAALTGTYPKACIRKYWSVPKRDYMMHETGLRILIRKIQLIGMQYDKALLPIFSYFKDHYFRIFFQCSKGKKLCDEIAEKHGMINDAGPLWVGNLWDSKLVSKMYSTMLKDYNKKVNTTYKLNNNKTMDNYENKKIIKNNIINNAQNNKGLLRFLKIIKEESKINVVGFFDIHDIVEKEKLKTIKKKETIIKKIKKRGFKATNTHFSGTGIRSNISYDRLISLLKE